MRVADHAAHRQVLDHDDRLGFRQCRGRLAQEGLALTADAAVQSRQSRRRPAPVTRSALFAAMQPLAVTQAAQGARPGTEPAALCPLLEEPRPGVRIKPDRHPALRHQNGTADETRLFDHGRKPIVLRPNTVRTLLKGGASGGEDLV